MTILFKQLKETSREDLDIRLVEKSSSSSSSISSSSISSSSSGNSRRKSPDILQMRSLHKRYNLTFNSSYHTGIKKNDTVYSEIFVCKKIDAPLVLLLHGLGSKQSSLKNYYCFIEQLVESGLNCIFLNLPFHLKRTPDGEKSGERNLYFDDIETLKFYHQAIVDIRRLLDIIAGIFNFSKNIICGFSLGSMIAAIALAVEERFAKGVLILSGGNWHEIHWNSTLSFFLKGNCLKNEGDMIDKKKCRKIYRGYPAFLKEFKRIKDPGTLDFQLSSEKDLKKKTIKQCFLCDPLTYAHLIDPERVMMINSRFDHFFNKKSTELLRDELGNPEIYWFNSLHTSRLICKRKVQNIIFDFISDGKPGMANCKKALKS